MGFTGAGRSSAQPATPANTAASAGQSQPPMPCFAATGASIALVAPTLVNPGFDSAAAKSSAEWKRSAGSLASALCTAAATFGGTVSRWVVSTGGFSVMTLATIAWAVLPV